MKRAIIIGGGASGLMAAISAARGGAKVTILEHQNQIGKKLLATGNGRCNFTNLDQHPSHYHSESPEIAEEVLKGFSVKETVSFFSELGIYPKNRNGYLYPYSDAASAVLEVLRMECERLKVKIACQIEILSIEKKEGVFLVKTPGWIYESECLIVAAGSQAASITGSDGSGYSFAKGFGHTVVEPYPALVQLLSREKFLKTLAGLRADAAVSLFSEGNKVGSVRGEIQVNAGNISGIPVFQISGKAAKLLAAGKCCEVFLDFMADFAEDALFDFFEERLKMNAQKTAENFLTGIFHKKLSQVICERCGFSKKIHAGDFTKVDISKLCKQIKNFQIEIYGTNGFEHAQCCGGGVSLREINPHTMESQKVSGLYFTGELLDVYGDCGGYNLQWAWTTGYLAGKAVNYD